MNEYHKKEKDEVSDYLLVTLKTKLDEAERKQNNLIGQQEVILKNLKELGFSSVDDAEKGLIKLQDQISKMELDLQKGIGIFREKYENLL